MERKLQVFISSTYLDLEDERQAAVQAVLDAGHIPAGMELFKSGNDSQLDVIKKWINSSDVYMLILGGRYGTLEPKSQKSYTQLEYEYALQLHKPIFAVVLSDTMLHKKASIHSDISFFETENITLYHEFKSLVLTKETRFINDVKDINIAVLSSLYDFSKNPKLRGWVREVSVGCSTDILHKCYKCGKEEILPPEPNFDSDDNGMSDLVRINRWHSIVIDTPGYGSDLDSTKLSLELCDECLKSFIDELVLKKLIYGDESWGPTAEDFEHNN